MLGYKSDFTVVTTQEFSRSGTGRENYNNSQSRVAIFFFDALWKTGVKTQLDVPVAAADVFAKADVFPFKVVRTHPRQSAAAETTTDTGALERT